METLCLLEKSHLVMIKEGKKDRLSEWQIRQKNLPEWKNRSFNRIVLLYSITCVFTVSISTSKTFFHMSTATSTEITLFFQLNITAEIEDNVRYWNFRRGFYFGGGWIWKISCSRGGAHWLLPRQRIYRMKFQSWLDSIQMRLPFVHHRWEDNLH